MKLPRIGASFFNRCPDLKQKRLIFNYLETHWIKSPQTIDLKVCGL